jgi:hypothetical protein
MADVNLRFRVNSQALSKAAMVLSNGVVLAANVYLVGSNIHQSFTSRKQSRVSESLQMSVDIAQTLAGLTKVVTEIVGEKHASSQSL